MRKLAALLLFAPAFGFAQAPAKAPVNKEYKLDLSGDMELVYHVNAARKTDGSYYIHNSKNGQVALKGMYANGSRSGSWYVYNESGALESGYNFDQQKLFFWNPDLSSRMTVNILQKGEAAANSTAPVLLCPVNLYLALVAEKIVIPQNHFYPKGTIDVQIKAVIEPGKAPEYSVVYTFQREVFEKKINYEAYPFEIAWIPAMYNKEPVKSEVLVKGVVNDPSQAGGHQRFRWN